MKKEYINPTMDIVEMEAPQMLAGSDISIGEAPFDGDDSKILSRELDDIFDF